LVFCFFEFDLRCAERSGEITRSLPPFLSFDSDPLKADIGAAFIETFALNQLTYDEIPGDGIIFATYPSLIAKSRGSARRFQSRYDQLVAWTGENFDGCFLFDECHRAKNFNAENPKNGTKTAKAVINLQRALPHSRVVYCSATGITMPKHMSYLGRLGLWGAGTPYPSFKHFLETINQPLGARELVVSRLHSHGLIVLIVCLPGGRVEEERSLSLSLIVFCWC
jgi:hypothetical protein